LTIERAIFALVLIVATGLRFFLLTNQPLNALEAANSWRAWLVANGDPTALILAAPNSPLLQALYTTSYWLLGGSDTLARAIPALCGVGTIWLLWYWRDWLGRERTILAALLMAIEPWLVAYSRLGDSVGISLFLGMLTLTSLLQLAKWQEQAGSPLEGEQSSDEMTEEGSTQEATRAEKVEDHLLSDQIAKWQQIAAVALGLLIISGPQMWSWLVLLVLFIATVLPATVRQQLVAQRSFWLLLGGAAIIGGTGWLTNPAGLSALSTSLTDWLRGWSSGPEAYSLNWLWIRLVADEPLILFFGLIGLGLMWRASAGEQSGERNFLSAWLVWGLLLVLAPGRSPMVLAMVALPLLFLSTYSLAHLLQDAQLGVAWRENGLLVLVLAILTVSSAFILATFSQNPIFDGARAGALIFILVLVAVLTIASALWTEGRQARLVLGSGVGLLLLLWTANSSWALNHHFDLRYPDGFFSTYTNPDVKTLAANVAMLSAQRNGDATDLALQVQMDGAPDPVLGWYLREMRNLRWVLAPGMVNGQSPTVVITPPDAVGVEGLRAAYMGSTYAIHDQWSPTDLIGNGVAAVPNPEAGWSERAQQRLNNFWSARGHALLRWIIYHKISTMPPAEQVILWVAIPEEAGQ